jgi:NDP-sugar pyrophosphorylase family protein
MRDRNDGTTHHPLTAVVLAGGQGTRLRPYTISFPKPLVPVGDRPILEILIRQLARDGFERLIIAVGHLSELIEAYFGDGSRWGVSIEYAREEEPLGTAGPLRSVASNLPASFLVINGDVLSDLDYAAFLRSHTTNPEMPALTISTQRRTLSSEYGVLVTDTDDRVIEYLEKPSYDLRVSEGVYAFSHEALKWIPDRERFDFPDVVIALMAAGEIVHARPHDGLWLDIGRPEDYERAQQLVSEHPERFLMTLTEVAPEPHRSHPTRTTRNGF